MNLGVVLPAEPCLLEFLAPSSSAAFAECEVRRALPCTDYWVMGCRATEMNDNILPTNKRRTKYCTLIPFLKSVERFIFVG